MQTPINITQCPSTIYNTETNDVILLVQGGTNPALVISLVNETYNTITQTKTSEPIDVSTAEVLLKLKTNNNVFSVIVGTPIAGLVLSNGSISYESPYDQQGKGGRVSFYWSENDLSKSGNCQGEVSINYSANNIQTVYNLLPIKIRPQF